MSGKNGPFLMVVNIIAAIDNKGGLGKNGSMAWHSPQDLKRFRELTMGKPVVMGNKTLKALPGYDKTVPLDGRTCIVLTRNRDYFDTRIILQYSLENAIERAAEISNECFIIGGAQIYAEALRLGIVDKMYLTLIDKDFDCDVFFPEYDKSEWVQTSRALAGDIDEYTCEYIELERIKFGAYGLSVGTDN